MGFCYILFKNHNFFSYLLTQNFVNINIHLYIFEHKKHAPVITIRYLQSNTKFYCTNAKTKQNFNQQLTLTWARYVNKAVN